MNFFVFVGDDGTRNQAYLNAMREETLQRLGFCYICDGKEKADTWLRNLSSKTPQGTYSEYLVGPKCRGDYGVQVPKWYSKFKLMENAFESMPYTEDSGCHVAKGGEVDVK